jgi:predicted RecA/RadA family phage recombinase
MAKATYKRGEIRTAVYTAGADIAVDDIVILGVIDAKKCKVGVAREAIASGSTGIVAVSGVFEFPKVTGAVIKAGESVNWDSDPGGVEDNAHATGAGDVKEFGAAMTDAGSGVLLIDVDIAEPGTYDAA